MILASTDPRIFGGFAVSLYAFLVLSSLGIVLVIPGAGLCLTFSFRGLTRNFGKSPLTVPTERIDGGLFAGKNLRYGFIAFLQSSIVLTLYSGLTAEYESNSSMQLWLRSIFPPSQVLLSNEAIFITAGLLGLLIVQFLPGQAFAE